MRVLDLYMIHHQEPIVPVFALPSFIQHIQSGKATSSLDLGMMSDDTGDHISHLNPHFGELSVQYWVWKNRRDVQYVGFQHYRRVFNFSNRYGFMPVAFPLSYEFYQTLVPQFIDFDKILNQLTSTPFIVPAKVDFRKQTIQEQYEQSHNKSDWSVFISFLEQKLTPSYKPYIQKMNQDTKFHATLMFVSSFEAFDQYMSWLFDILFDLYDVLPKPEEGYQSRTIAYLAERLFHLYILYYFDHHLPDIKTMKYPCFHPIKPRLIDRVYFN